MIDHPDDRTIEHFTIGAMDDVAASTFAAHVSSCDACSEKLAREARLELALGEVHALRARGRSARPVEPRKASVTRILFPALALAAAAAIVAFVRVPGRHDVRADPSVVVLAGNDAPRAAGDGASDPAAKPSDADEVVAKMRPAFRSCYASALALDLAVSGKAVLLARIAPDGGVRDVDIDTAQGLTAELVTCLANVVRRGRFKGTGAAATVPVAVSFVQN